LNCNRGPLRGKRGPGAGGSRKKNSPRGLRLLDAVKFESAHHVVIFRWKREKVFRNDLKPFQFILIWCPRPNN